MINDEVQKQNNGDDSVNIQTKGNNNTYYITKTTAKEELLELFIENFPKLRQLAKEVVDDRINQLIEQYLNKISQLDEPIANRAYKRMSEPDLQYTIWETQKNYAKSGDKDKLEQLTSLLIDKSIEEPKTLMDYILDEAIQKVSMLTQKQMDVLSYMVYKHCNFLNIKNISDLYNEFLFPMLKFRNSLNINPSNLSYMQQLGVITNFQIKVSGNELISLLKNNCQGLFATGFTKEEFLSSIENKDLLTSTKQCLNNTNLLQLTPITMEEYNHFITQNDITENDKQRLWSFFNRTMTNEQIIFMCASLNQDIEQIFIEDQFVSNSKLTPLGILLGIKNLELKYNEKINWDFT